MYERKNQDRSPNIDLQRLHTCGFRPDARNLVLEPVPHLLKPKCTKGYTVLFLSQLDDRVGCDSFPFKTIKWRKHFPQLGRHQN